MKITHYTQDGCVFKLKENFTYIGPALQFPEINCSKIADLITNQNRKFNSRGYHEFHFQCLVLSHFIQMAHSITVHFPE